MLQEETEATLLATTVRKSMDAQSERQGDRHGTTREPLQRGKVKSMHPHCHREHPTDHPAGYNYNTFVRSGKR